MKERRPAPSGEADGIIEGRNAVTEALLAGCSDWSSSLVPP